LGIDEIGAAVHVLDADGLDDLPARAANLVVTDDARLAAWVLAVVRSGDRGPVTR
jgi:hypothetical protein